MLRRLVVVLPLIISALTIKVPVENTDDSASKETTNNTSHSEHRPIYYESEEEDQVDSYLIPPNPHKDEEVLPDSIVTPATYLLPPSIDKQNDYYYAPTESTGQSDWYPIVQSKPQDQTIKLLPLRQQSAPIPIFMDNINPSGPFEIYQRPRVGKTLNSPTPSRNLEPPAENAPNDYIIDVPSKELELPAEEIDQQYVQPDRDYPNYKFRLNSEHPTIASHLTPPKVVHNFKNPTKLYPKKYPGSFTPVPIPIAQYADDLPLEAPKAKPVKYFKPSAGVEGPILIPIDDKKTYLYQQAEEKRKFKGENEALQGQEVAPSDNLSDIPPAEQDASETNFRYPGHNSIIYRPHPAPLRQRPAPSPAPAPAAQIQQQGPPATDDRTEFRMHGMKGPHSYQFGYDTGKGKNRQFRFEERDNDGQVRGHYGYMDKSGKLRVVNYRAHPEYGFQAEPQIETQAEPKAESQEEAREP